MGAIAAKARKLQVHDCRVPATAPEGAAPSTLLRAWEKERAKMERGRRRRRRVVVRGRRVGRRVGGEWSCGQDTGKVRREEDGKGRIVRIRV